MGNFTLLISIIFFLATAASALTYALVVRKASIADPIVQFILFFCLFVVPLPLRAWMTLEIDGDVTPHLAELLPFIPKAVFLSAVGLIFFVPAYYSRTSYRIAAHIPQIRGGQRSLLAFLVLAAFSLFLIIQLATSVGGLFSLLLLGYGVTSEMTGKGYLAMGFTWFFVACMFLLYGYASTGKRKYLLAFGIGFSFVVLTHLVMARRATLLYMGLAVWLFWHHAVRPLKSRTLIVTGVVGFVALNLVGVLRSSSYESVGDMWDKTSTSWESERDTNFQDLTYTLTTGEFVVPFETLPQMIESVGASISPELGMTYIRAPLQFIPQALFPSRPAPLQNWYIAKFYGGGFGTNEGRAFFFLSEGYLNFGSAGVIATMIAWGLCLGSVHAYISDKRRTVGGILLCSLIIAFIYVGIAGESISIIVGLPETSLVAAMIGLWMTTWGTSKSMRALRLTTPH